MLQLKEARFAPKVVQKVITAVFFLKSKVFKKDKIKKIGLLLYENLLPKLFKNTEHHATERVRVARLDSFPEHWQHAQRAFLKIDVQGLELQVLQGAPEALKHCAYVYVECSHVELYRGQALFDDVKTFLEERGFHVTKRLNEDVIAGKLIQADYLFERKSGE